MATILNETSAETLLVERLRSRDHSAVADLAARYSPRIRQLALRYIRSEDEADEVVQDVLLKIYQKIETFRGDSALSSWIYRITFNTAMSRLRAARASRRASLDVPVVSGQNADASGTVPDVADWSLPADDELIRAELRKKLVKALAELPAIYRIPVLLRDVQGLSTEEASAVLRVKDQTLKSRLHRGRMILRDQLAEFASGLRVHRRGASTTN